MSYPYDHPAIPIWNALVRLGFFTIVAALLSALRTRLLMYEAKRGGKDAVTFGQYSRVTNQVVSIEERSTLAASAP